MTKTRFSHAACDHASTKAARAACRKQMRGEAVASTVTAPKPVAVTPAKKDPRKVAAKPAAPVETPADETAPAAEPIETAPAADLQEVTRETWREFKEQRVTVHVVGVEEPFSNLELTGWSIKLIQFKDADGKSHRLPATTVEKVTV